MEEKTFGELVRKVEVLSEDPEFQKLPIFMVALILGIFNQFIQLSMELIAQNKLLKLSRKEKQNEYAQNCN